MRERLHLVAFHRAREQVDGEHLVGKRERLLRADVRAAATLHAIAGEMFHAERAVLVGELADGAGRTERRAHLAAAAFFRVDDDMAPQARLDHDVLRLA